MIMKFINCKILRLHNWTCASEQGKEPNYAQIRSVVGFWDYAKMYCKDCGLIYKESLRLMQNAKL